MDTLQQLQASVLATLDHDDRKANGKRWGKRLGYYGAQGGWVYNSQHRPIVQGWAAFFNRHQSRILDEVALGTFKLTCRPKPVAPAVPSPAQQSIDKQLLRFFGLDR